MQKIERSLSAQKILKRETKIPDRKEGMKNTVKGKICE